MRAESATTAAARAAAEVFHSTGILQRRWRLKAKHTQCGSEVVQPKYCVGTEPERIPRDPESGRLMERFTLERLA